MQVYQIRIKLYVMKDIPVERVQEKLAQFIDTGFAVSRELLQMHEENRFKYYCFDSLYPVEKDKVYRQGCIYTVTIRTIERKLADYFYEVCVNHFTENFKGDCLLAVGDEELIKIHFHTNEPWKVLEYCASIGEIYDIVVEDMDRQSRGLKG